MNKKIFFLAAALSIALFSCKKDEPEVTLPPSSGYLNGLYVANEGNFTHNDASISFISSDGTVSDDPYFDVNGVSVGDVLTCFLPYNGLGYAVMNNSQKVEVVTLKTFAHKTEITGCDYPRYILPVSATKAYLTNGSFAGDVKVIDLTSNTISSTIAVGQGPEKIAVSGTYAAVCNSGGWSTDNTVSIINTATDAVVETVTLGDRPNDVVVDGNGNFWVLCSGETLYDLNWNVIGNTAAGLYKIDISTYAVTSIGQVGILGDHPRQLEIAPDGQHIYYENNGIYSYNVAGGSFPGNLLISGAFSGINVHPSTGELWVMGIPYSDSGSSVYQYSSAGALQRTYTCGIGSNGVAF